MSGLLVLADGLVGILGCRNRTRFYLLQNLTETGCINIDILFYAADCFLVLGGVQQLFYGIQPLMEACQRFVPLFLVLLDLGGIPDVHEQVFFIAAQHVDIGP